MATGLQGAEYPSDPKGGKGSKAVALLAQEIKPR